MKKKILLISSIILGVVIICITIFYYKKCNTNINESKLESTSISQESIIGQNNINAASTYAEAQTEDKENEVTEENEQETKDEIIRDTEDKSNKRKNYK